MGGSASEGVCARSSSMSGRPESRTPGRSSKGCDLEVEPARARSPYAPPALFTGTGALYDTPTSKVRPLSAQLRGIDSVRGEPTERRHIGLAAARGGAIRPAVGVVTHRWTGNTVHSAHPKSVIAITRRSPGRRVDVVLAHVRLSLGLSRREGRKPLCDLGIPAFGCVLITQCRAGCRVPEPAHELGQRRPRLSTARTAPVCLRSCQRRSGRRALSRAG